MSVPFSLLAKAIGGVAAVAAPVATSVYYKDSIYGLFNAEKESTTALPDQTQNEEESLKIGNDTEGKINLTYKDKGECSITVNDSSNLSKVKTELEKLLGNSDLNENNKRHRRGLIKKCKAENGNKNINFTVSTTENIDLSPIFDLSNVTLNSEEILLASKAWTSTVTINEDKLTVTINVSTNTQSENNSKISVGTCKIIGSKGTEEIEKEHLTNSKSEIEAAIKTETDKTDNAEGKKKFLQKCKRDFNNEIKLTLKKKTDESNNKYELENLSEEFQAAS